jgi:hypothetical protein
MWPALSMGPGRNSNPSLGRRSQSAQLLNYFPVTLHDRHKTDTALPVVGDQEHVYMEQELTFMLCKVQVILTDALTTSVGASGTHPACQDILTLVHLLLPTFKSQGDGRHQPMVLV